MKQESSALTGTEQRELRKYEDLIQEGLSRFVAVGTALHEIRSKKLYRGHYENFSEYLHSRWDMSMSNASRLIKGSEVASRIPEIKNEGQAREILRVPYTDQKSVFERAQAIAINRDSGMTAAIINEAASEPSSMTSRPEDGAESPWDLEGRSELWQLAEDTATELRSITRKIALHPQGCWLKGQIGTVEQKIRDIFTCLEFSKPFSPCPECAGGLRRGCSVCRDRGWLPRTVSSALKSKETKKKNSDVLDMGDSIA